MSLKRKYLIFLIIPLLAFTLHKYYISLTKVEYKEESNSVQITMRIFIDDLQEAINTTYHKNLELDEANKSNEIDTLIRKYISPKFKVTINKVESTYSYLGKEFENDVVYLYLEIKKIKMINAIEIKNDVLMELFSDQINIIKLKINGSKKTFLLTNQKDKELLKL